VLADAPSAATEPLRFVFNPADPTPTIGGRLLLAVAAGYRDDGALAERADVLSFTGPELCADLEIIGVPYVELAHAVDTPSADVAVRISEVDPNGHSRNISDGYVRIGGIPRHRWGSSSIRSRTGFGWPSDPTNRSRRGPSSSARRTSSTASVRGWCFRGFERENARGAGPLAFIVDNCASFKRGRYCYFGPFDDLAPSDPARWRPT
jgi:hypothetical protein